MPDTQIAWRERSPKEPVLTHRPDVRHNRRHRSTAPGGGGHLPQPPGQSAQSPGPSPRHPGAGRPYRNAISEPSDWLSLGAWPGWTQSQPVLGSLAGWEAERARRCWCRWQVAQGGAGPCHGSVLTGCHRDRGPAWGFRRLRTVTPPLPGVRGPCGTSVTRNQPRHQSHADGRHRRSLLAAGTRASMSSSRGAECCLRAGTAGPPDTRRSPHGP